jgi:transcriptional regulator of acetoin/glycerol metabolism
LVEVRDAARAAADDDTCSFVEARHLAQDAGRYVGDEGGAHETGHAPDLPRPTNEMIVETLRAHAGNIARTARALGVHRTQLRRWMLRDGIDARQYAEEGDST